MIDAASVADAEVMAAIHAMAFPPSEAWGRDVFQLQLALPNVRGLLHADGGMILLRAAGGEAEVLTLAVAPAFRRKGAGGALLRGGIAAARAIGAQALLLEVSVTNDAARALYAREGFTEVGVRPRYYADLSDALVLCLKLCSSV